jgi:hypothetical protein
VSRTSAVAIPPTSTHGGIGARASLLEVVRTSSRASFDPKTGIPPAGIAAQHGEGNERVVELERHLALQLERDGRGEASRIGEGQAEDPVADALSGEGRGDGIRRARTALRDRLPEDRRGVGTRAQRHAPAATSARRAAGRLQQGKA